MALATGCHLLRDHFDAAHLLTSQPPSSALARNRLLASWVGAGVGELGHRARRRAYAPHGGSGLREVPDPGPEAVVRHLDLPLAPRVGHLLGVPLGAGGHRIQQCRCSM